MRSDSSEGRAVLCSPEQAQFFLDKYERSLMWSKAEGADRLGKNEILEGNDKLRACRYNQISRNYLCIKTEHYLPILAILTHDANLEECI